MEETLREIKKCRWAQAWPTGEILGRLRQEDHLSPGDQAGKHRRRKKNLRHLAKVMCYLVTKGVETKSPTQNCAHTASPDVLITDLSDSVLKSKWTSCHSCVMPGIRNPMA
jgi:hypothetical protein